MRIYRVAMLMILGFLASPAWADGERTVDTLAPEVQGSVGDLHLRLATPSMPVTPLGRSVREVALEFSMDLPVGTTLELWSHSGEGLPWDSEGGTIVDAWTLDERTGGLVRFQLPPALQAGSTLWVRLDPVHETLPLTAKAVRRADRVIALSHARRRSP